jgi:ornithine decarboxylase
LPTIYAAHPERYKNVNYEVQGVFQERKDGRIKFYTYVVRE